MRGQKVSLSTSKVENNSDLGDLYKPDLRYLRSSPDEEDDELTFLIEKDKRISYNDAKRLFKENREKGRNNFSPAKGAFSSSKKTNDLGIPSGKYLYFNVDSSSKLTDFTRKELETEEPYSITKIEPVKSKLEKTLQSQIFKLLSGSKKPLETEEPYSITKIEPVKFKLDKTLRSQLFKLLSDSKKPLHINYIIEKLVKLKVIKKITLHTYSTVYRTLNRNKYLFMLTGKAQFSVRKGFRKWAKPTITVRPSINSNKDPISFKTLLIESFKHIAVDGFSNPSDVYNFLLSFGYKGIFISIYNGMQSSPFIRNDEKYSLANE